MALEFSGAFEECWSNARTSEVGAEALNKFLAQAASRKQARGRGAGSVQFGLSSASDQSPEDLADPDNDSKPKDSDSKPKRSLK